MNILHLSDDEVAAILLVLRSSRKQGYIEFSEDEHLIALQAEEKLKALTQN